MGSAPHAWTLASGGPGSGLYRSTDGGTTWKHLEEHGLPKGPYGRIGVAVAANSERVYAIIEAKEGGGLYRSDDGGDTWQLVNGSHGLMQRAVVLHARHRRSAGCRHGLRGGRGVFQVHRRRAQLSTRSRFRTATITGCGSIRRIPKRMIAVERWRRDGAVWMAASPGRAKIISRPRSSITSSPTRARPTTSTVRSRTTRAWPLPAAATTARLAATTGIRSEAGKRAILRRYPTGSEYCLCGRLPGQSDALRPAHEPGQEHRGVAGADATRGARRGSNIVFSGRRRS